MLKKKKAAGFDGIPNEVWIHGGENLVNKLIGLIGKVWNGEDIPEDWKIGIIVPLYKKGDPNNVANYRGITLLSTAYKLYTEVLRRRLEKEVNDKGLLPENQAGFRKRRSTIDNIYILNHITQKAKNKKKRIYAMFVDFKAAFDTVDRNILWEIMENAGISNYITERLKGVYEETKVKVRIGNEITKEFWITKGLRQGCVLSPILFCLYIAELEDVFRERNIGGIRLGNERIWSLAYADDIVILAENREALLDMCGTMKKFIKKRRLILSTEKTKILVFNKGKNGKKEKWKWDKDVIEEVKIFKYLGFIFNSESNYRAHIMELKRKGNIAAKKTWGLGEKRCKGDFRRRMMLFEYLVRSVMEYGVEIWGWSEKTELENIKTNFIRGILKLDFCTPKSIIYKETWTKKLALQWGARAIRYEEKLSKLGGNRLVKICWEEKNNENLGDLYSTEREKYYNDAGFSYLYIRLKLMQGENVEREVYERKYDIEEQILTTKIKQSRYNKRYKELVVCNIPRYLQNRNGGKYLSIIARIRCGNFENANKYWLGELERQCVLCKLDWGTWDHYMEECEKTVEWTENLPGENTID